MELRLLPKRPISWFIWLGLLVICLPRYYSSFPFPQLIYQYEAEMWTRPREVHLDNEKWSVTVRSPKTIADFTDVPMSVLVRNQQASPANALVSATLRCRNSDAICEKSIAYTRALVRNSVQSSIFLENVPANGEVITWFDLRAVVQADGDAASEPGITLETNIEINRERVFQGDEVFEARFNRDRVFRLWAIENLLSPPGSNILIPIFFLFIVVIFEIVADVVILLRKGEAQGELKAMYFCWPSGTRKKILVIVRWLFSILLVFGVILFLAQLALPKPWTVLGPFFANDPVNAQIRRTIFWFVLGAVGIGALFGTVLSTHKS
jgi:hypothetical protein